MTKRAKPEYVSEAEEKEAVNLFGDENHGIYKTLMSLVSRVPLNPELDNAFRQLYANAMLMADSGAYRCSLGMSVILDNIRLAYRVRQNQNRARISELGEDIDSLRRFVDSSRAYFRNFCDEIRELQPKRIPIAKCGGRFHSDRWNSNLAESNLRYKNK
jgi:hypothetical protein